MPLLVFSLILLAAGIWRLVPEPPPPYLVPSCAEAGVLGILPGTIGTFQAIKHKIADLKIFLETSRSLAYRIAWCKDQGRPLNHLEAAVAKLFMGDWSLKPANEATTGGEPVAGEPKDLELVIDAQGRYYLDGKELVNTRAETVYQALQEAIADEKLSAALEAGVEVGVSAIAGLGDELVSTLRETGPGSRQVLRVGALATLSRNFQSAYLEPLFAEPNVLVVVRSGDLEKLLHDTVRLLSNNAARKGLELIIDEFHRFSSNFIDTSIYNDDDDS